MKPLLFFLGLTFLCSLTLLAQDTTWFDSEWNDCSRDQAMYYHLEHAEGDVTHFKDYYKANNQVQNSGQYRDGERFGLFVWFDENGLKTSDIEYIDENNDGEFVGIWKFYNEKGEEVPGGQLIGEFDWDNYNGETPDGVEFGSGEAETDPDPDEFILVEQEPYPLNKDEVKKAIGYPPMAWEAGIEGKVTLRILVGKTGLYERHVVVREEHPTLCREVEKHVSKLRFSPGIKDGHPVKLWLSVPFKFDLNYPND